MWTEKGGCPSVAPIEGLRQCERAVVRGVVITPTNARRRAGRWQPERKNGPVPGGVRKSDVASEEPRDPATDREAEAAARCSLISGRDPDEFFENSLAEIGRDSGAVVLDVDAH